MFVVNKVNKNNVIEMSQMKIKDTGIIVGCTKPTLDHEIGSLVFRTHNGVVKLNDYGGGYFYGNDLVKFYQVKLCDFVIDVVCRGSYE